MSSAFDVALTDAAAFLRQLGPERDLVQEAHRRFEDFLSAHHGVTGALAADLPPGSSHVGYDILLDSPEGGTIAVSYTADKGNPWLADYAEHWAANYVVSVGDAHLTVPDALISLRLAAKEYNGLTDVLLDHAIIANAIKVQQIRSTPAEEQAAADDFRRGLGLETAAATQAWLRDRGWSKRQLQLLISGGVRARKLQERIVGNSIENYFAEHVTDFDVVRLVRVDVRDASDARDLREHTGRGSLVEAVLSLGGASADRAKTAIVTARARELPPELSAGARGEIIGPIVAEAQWCVAQILDRRPAALDRCTRQSVADALFRRWLDEQRSQATIRWHWM